MTLLTGKAWNAYDGYLFDIDGTLVHCADATHYFAFCDALLTISGRTLNLDGVIAHGNTDIGILRDALTLAGVPEAEWRQRLPETLSQMCIYVESHRRHLQVTVLPGVRDLLADLKTRKAVLGLATGNLKRIGEAKLRSADLLDYFDLGGWSDEFEYRADVFQSAAEQMRSTIGTHAQICIVGDTPADILAARANDLPVIAVATGVYSRDDLAQHKPDHCVCSFKDLISS